MLYKTVKISCCFRDKIEDHVYLYEIYVVTRKSETFLAGTCLVNTAKERCVMDSLGIFETEDIKGYCEKYMLETAMEAEKHIFS